MLKISFVKDIYSFFSRKEKNYFHLLIVLILVSTFLELIGIGMIIPVLEIFVNENAVKTNRFTLFFFNLFQFDNQNQFILFFSIILVLFFLVKGILLAIIIKFTIFFANFLNYHWTSNLFKVYTSQPYIFFSKNNSSILIRNLKDEIGHTVHGIILQFSHLIAETFLVIGILIFLLYLQPLMTFLALIYFVLINFSYFYVTKKFLYSWGQQRQYYEGLRFKNLIQTFNGIKEIKLNSSENEFTEMYFNHSKKSITLDGKSNFINALPRLMFEIFSIVVFVIFIYVIILSQKPLLEFVPIMGVFAFSAFKLLPSSNKILNCFQLIRYHLPSFYIVKDELNLSSKNSDFINSKSITFNKDINFQNISISYDNNLILENLNFQINKNEFIGIIGQSGSGKSTLINLLLGLIKPDHGDIKSDGVSIYNSEKNWQQKISFIPQEIFLFDDSIKKNVAFTTNEKFIDENRVLESIKKANLSTFVENLNNGINTTVGERGLKISGGQKQRIGIARALYKKSEILIFDEATSNLDQKTENELMSSILNFKGKKTIIIIAHRMNIIKQCDKVYEIKNKNISLINIRNKINE